MSAKNAPKVTVPPAPDSPQRQVTEVLHGQTITDPYRWLEDSDSTATQQWTEKQNSRTETVLSQIPYHDTYREELTRVLAYEAIGAPQARNETLFYTHRPEGADQPRLCMRREGTEQVLLDPNERDEAGLVALDWWQPSPDGSLVAYGCSRSGDEWSTLQILDTETRQILPVSIERARMSSIAWEPDNSAFFYTRHPLPGEVPEGEEFYNRRVFYHRMGQDPSQDPVIFGEGRPKEEMYQVSLSPDGQHLMVSVGYSRSRNDLYVRDRNNPGAGFVPIIAGEDALFTGKITEGVLYLLTNFRAPRYRIVAVDLSDPRPECWEDIVPEQPDLVLREMKIADGHLAITCLRDATSCMYLCELDGSHFTEVDLPFPGTVSDLTLGANENLFFTLQSYVRPPGIYRLNMRDRTVREVRTGSGAIDPDDYEVHQVMYTSGDGTRIPMSIIHHRKTDLEQSNPTVLTGYGGFNASRTPTYLAAQIPWLKAGGVFAVANLRGGSEYGEQWHRAGMLGNKQNVFDDFIAAAKYLVDQRYTTPERLGILGGSNGGLLVGAAMTQRPDLFGAVACGVPLLDMIRYHRFLIASIWIPEYGSAEDPEQFEWLRAYSPYHNVNPETQYPPVLLYTATADSRVHPLHARKMAALLQRGDSSDRPVLLFVEEDAGHGVGKPVNKMVEGQARIWTFLSWQLDLDIRG